jgi:putative CocE/NonD family hydrolase
VPHSIRIDRDVEMKTRDGVTVRADVARPMVDDKLPALVCRTPYDKALRLRDYRLLPTLVAAAYGFAVVYQDVRGRFASDGNWRPMAWDDVEATDGYDCIEWVASESWCNGCVGMIGGSYEGLNQLAAARRQPPGLRAIAPALLGAGAESARRTTMMLEGIVLSWSALMAADLLDRARRNGDVDTRAAANVLATMADPARAAWTLPLSALPTLSVLGMPSYRQLIDLLLRAGAAAGSEERITVPSLWVSGWYDHAVGTQQFRALRARGGSAAARAQTKMILGPWSHTQHEVALGELGFGQFASLLGAGVPQAHLRFFGRHLRGDDVPELPAVKYFVMGVNLWKEASDWPIPGTEWRHLYLHSHGAANGVSGDGGLDWHPPRSEERPDRYRYDPAQPVPAIGFRALNLGGSTVPGPFDQARVERRPDVLVYTSEPLDAPLEVVGDIELCLCISSNAPDTDFVAKLCDVDPSGRSLNIADGVLRARWREGGSEETFLERGAVYRLRIDLGPTGHAFLPGHRIRLQVTSSAFPHFDRNLNTGHPIGVGVQGVVAEQTIYHDAEHPSYLVLPIQPSH